MFVWDDAKIMLSGGEYTEFKIECDALTKKDIACFAKLICEKTPFCEVVSVPTGGDRIAKELRQYCTIDGPVLIVDDVLTTGASMNKAKAEISDTKMVIGVVLFARREPPKWIIPIFRMY